MPILYDKVIVYPTGILTIQNFKPPIDQRMVKFELPNGYAQKVVFTCIDNIYSGPFTTAAPLKSEIRGLELLRAGAHNATVIVINTAESPIGPVICEFKPTLNLSSGEKVPLNLTGTISATVRVENSNALLRDYIKNGVTSAEATISSILAECLRKEIVDHIKEYCSSIKRLNDMGGLDALADDIRANICRNAENFLDYNWFTITACSLDLKASNWDEIIQKENYLWNKKEAREEEQFQTDEEVRKELELLKPRLIEKTVDTLLSVYRRDPIPKEVCQLIATYLNNNPNTSTDNLITLCERIKVLSQTFSPEMILKCADQLGYLPDKSKP